jgi:outer membrane protein TolC
VAAAVGALAAQLLPAATLARSTSGPTTLLRRRFAERTKRCHSDAKNSLGDEQWSAGLQEPELQELIRKALANNYDVRIAAQHILEQQAQVQDHALAAVSDTLTLAAPASAPDLPSSLGTQIRQPAGRWIVQSLRCVDAGLLGPLSQADRGCARAVAGADLGAARVR